MASEPSAKEAGVWRTQGKRHRSLDNAVDPIAHAQLAHRIGDLRAPTPGSAVETRREVLRVLGEANEALYWNDLTHRLVCERAAVQAAVTALDQEGILASDDGDEPFYLCGRWSVAG